MSAIFERISFVFGVLFIVAAAGLLAIGVDPELALLIASPLGVIAVIVNPLF
jgi:hypothetical protein